MEFLSRVSAHVGQNHELCLVPMGAYPGHYGNIRILSLLEVNTYICGTVPYKKPFGVLLITKIDA